MERIREFFRRIPLIAVLLLTSCILSLVAFLAAPAAYEAYPVDPVRMPWLTIVLEGIHDGVFPWSRPGEEAAKDPAAQAAEAPAPAGEEAAGEEEPAEEAPAKEEPVKEEPAVEEPVQEETPAPAGEPAQEEPVEEPKIPAGDRDPLGLYDLDENVDPKPSGKAPAPLPDNVSSPVLGAEDLGNANRIFMSPSDTVYNSDTRGLFGRTDTLFTFETVDDSYFENALFIGDSRTTGFAEYGGLRDMTSFLSRDSVTVYTLLDHKLQFRKPGSRAEERFLEDVLREIPYDKIYIAIGVNELGIPDTLSYYNKYRKIVAMIHQLQPEAILYLQGSMHVSKKISKGSDTYNNTIIVQRNKAIASLANGRSIFYLDMNPAVCDDKGNLIESYSGDGIHLFASKYGLWHEFLKTHAIVRE